MQVYLWAFISVLYYMSSGRVSFAVGSFFVMALVNEYPTYGIPLLVLAMMYLMLLVLKLYQSLDATESKLKEYKDHVDFLEARHTQFLDNTFKFTSHVRQVFTPMVREQPKEKNLDEDS